MQGERRGGHIRNAKCLPYKWINYLDWIEIVRSKGILPGNTVILYGYDKTKTEKVAALLQKAGYENVRVYHGFQDEWSADNDLPMDRLARYAQLVSAEWLNELMSAGRAMEYTNNRFVICHAHYQNRADYEKGHIPGALDLDTNSLESPETWNMRSPEEIKTTLENMGITHDTTVILYGRFSFPDNDNPFPGSSAGHLGAIRCAFILMAAGVRDVRVLNGGLRSWEDEGFELSAEDSEIIPVKDFGIEIPVNPHLVVDTPQAKEILKAGDKSLVSVRSWREFTGEVSGYHYIKKKGRIPGAVFGNCGSDAYHMENFRNPDHTCREYHEIEKHLADAGITPDKFNAFYCGTGWRGSEAFFNVWLMGWPEIALYDGGWFEWSNDDSNPCETGIPEPKEAVRNI